MVMYENFLWLAFHHVPPVRNLEELLLEQLLLVIYFHPNLDDL